MADHAGCSGGRRTALAVVRRAVAALGIGSRHCSGAPDVLGRAGGPGTRGIAARRCCSSVVGGNLRSGWRGSDCVSSRAAIRGPFGPPAPIGDARTRPLRWRPDGSYLITGGLGDLGLLVARWMVEQGARRLILLGRTKLPAALELEFGRSGKSPGSSNRRHSGTGSLGSERASGVGRCGG